MNVTMTKSARSRAIARLLSLVSGACLLAGCAQGAGDREGPDTEWRDAIDSPDPEARAHAVDLLPGAPGADGIAVLEEMAIRDEDARVREQAVLAYERLAGEQGVRFLKNVALGDEAPEVRSAARAALHKIRTEHPQPARAWVKVEHPEHFAPGETFTVRVRFGSSESAPKAKLGMRWPDGFTVSEERDAPWRGAIEAGKENELTFQVTAPSSPTVGGVQLSFVVDYPEQLDLETVREKLRLEVGATEGRFVPVPPARVIEMNAAEVQP